MFKKQNLIVGIILAMVLFWCFPAMAEFGVSVPTDPTCGLPIWNAVEVHVNGNLEWVGDGSDGEDTYSNNLPGDTITVKYLPATAVCDWGHSSFGGNDPYNILGVALSIMGDGRNDYIISGTEYTFVDEDHNSNASLIRGITGIYTDDATAANPPVRPIPEGRDYKYGVSIDDMFNSDGSPKEFATITADLNGDGGTETLTAPWPSPYTTPWVITQTSIKLHNFEKRAYGDAGLITVFNFEPIEESQFSEYAWHPNWGIPFDHPQSWGLGGFGTDSKSELIDRNRIGSVVWENKGLSIHGQNLQYLHDYFMGVYYDMGSRFWFGDPCGWDPYEQGCEGGFTLADNYYRAPFFNILPKSDESQTFTVTIDSIPYEIVIGPSDFNKEMPVIPAVRQEQQIIYNKNGKEIAHGLSKVVVDVKNITAEYDSVGNLIVQWAEPIIAVPGIELKIEVMGVANDFDINNPDLASYGTILGGSFLWVDSPSQLGTAIITANELNALRARSSHTRGVLRIIYRDKQRPSVTINDEDAGQITTRNRGISALVEFVLQ